MVSRYGVASSLVIIVFCIGATGWVARTAYAQQGPGFMVGVVIGGAAFIGVLALVMKRTRVAIDRDAGSLRVGEKTEHRLVEIAKAEVEDVDDSNFCKVVLAMKDRSRIAIVEARSSDCHTLAKAINAAVAELSPKRVEVEEDEVETPDAVPEGTWAAAESVLRGLPLESPTVARNAEDRRVEAFVRGRPMRVTVDVRDISKVEILVEVSTGLDVLEVSWDEDAKRVVTDDEDEEKIFLSLPETLRKRINDAVSSGRVSTVAIFSDETWVTAPATAAQTRDSLDALLDLAADIAAHAASVPVASE